jgi:four helix bundle protein
MTEYNREKSPLHIKSYNFAVRIIKMVNYIHSSEKEYVITHQIAKSGTTIGAMVREAEFAQSPSDFISKLFISLKEANETTYWLYLLKDTNYINEKVFESMASDCNELIAILVTSIKTAKSRNINKQGK